MNLFKLKNIYLLVIFVLPFILLNSYRSAAPIFLFICLLFLYSLYQFCKSNFNGDKNKTHSVKKLQWLFIFLAIYGILQFSIISLFGIEVNNQVPILFVALILYNITALIVFVLFIIEFLRIIDIAPSLFEIGKYFFLFVFFPVGVFYLKEKLNKKMVN